MDQLEKFKEMFPNSAVYVTDDRDHSPENLRTLVIFPGGNGDWYVQVAGVNGITTHGVRLCTSGGASTQCPGLTTGIAMAYRAMMAAQRGDCLGAQPTDVDLEREVGAWPREWPSTPSNAAKRRDEPSSCSFALPYLPKPGSSPLPILHRVSG